LTRSGAPHGRLDDPNSYSGENRRSHADCDLDRQSGLSPLRPTARDGARSRGSKAGGLSLEPCDYPIENGNYAAGCGTIVVPENRADPHSRLIALPVIRIRARSDQQVEPIFRLEGGPGETNMDFPMASRFADDRYVVVVVLQV
jgi:hypothetical protein